MIQHKRDSHFILCITNGHLIRFGSARVQDAPNGEREKKNSVKIKQQKQRTAQQIEHTTLQRKSVQSAHYIHRV